MDSAWTARHRGICVLLWFHAMVLPLVAVLRGETLVHGLGEGVLVGWLALGAQVGRFSIPARSALATLGLLVSSAQVVHLFDGSIEAHFHFFVMVAVVALYQAWQPFLLALAFVVVHHSMAAALLPTEVYNHPAANAHPLLWGLVHGGFILSESVACLVYWRASEDAVRRERNARIAAQRAHRELANAQELSGVGSWEWDVASGTVTWSDQLYALAGADPATFTPTLESFLGLIHPEDRDWVAGLIESSYRDNTALNYECKLIRLDGAVRIVQAHGEVVTGEDAVVLMLRGTCHDVTERRLLQDQITQLAFHDPLTGLANRRLYLERLEQALARLRGTGASCAILFIDLDDFKGVNDRFGHATGDALLQDVANRLRSMVRETDTVARLGGDEFALLCEGESRDSATQTARRIEAALETPAIVEGHRVTVGASIGIAVADRGTTADSLLRDADVDMYAAKGRKARQSRGFGQSTVAS